MAICLGPDGVVVAEVDEAVSIAVERSTDRCLIKQMCTADLLVKDLVKDVLACRSFDDSQDVSDAADVQGTAVGWLSSSS